MFDIQAPAKINLSLQVIGKRSDGFHEIVSVMQTISLADVLTFFPAATVTFECSEPAIQTRDNLVMRAIRLVREKYSVTEGCRVHLDKRVPIAAGLGGGSSDAAAAIKGLVRLWDIDPDQADEISLAGQLGSDVPFFLHAGTALVAGRGERVCPLPNPPPQWYVLAKPRFPVSTASIFAALPCREWSDGNITHQMASRIRRGEQVELGVNDLQPSLFRLHSEARRCYERVIAATKLPALVSGSGPTVVGLCPDKQIAEAAAHLLRGKNYWAEVAHSTGKPV